MILRLDVRELTKRAFLAACYGLEDGLDLTSWRCELCDLAYRRKRIHGVGQRRPSTGSYMLTLVVRRNHFAYFVRLRLRRQTLP